MALTAAQRAKLPPSAFAYPPGTPIGGAKGKYPVPTRTQAARAGISPSQNLGLHRNARSRAAQTGTAGTLAHVTKISERRVANVGTPRKTRHK